MVAFLGVAMENVVSANFNVTQPCLECEGLTAGISHLFYLQIVITNFSLIDVEVISGFLVLGLKCFGW